MKFAALRESVCDANQVLAKQGLIVLTWGNASGVDRDAGVMAIKPSGVAYDSLTPGDIVVLDLATGATVSGEGRPSSDTPTHLHLYRSFPAIGGVVHTHSRHATVWAQAARELPCLGTTHADHFRGTVPVTRAMREEEVCGEYELNTGKVIAERFLEGGVDPCSMPAVLVAGHGPFTWGPTPMSAAANAIALEEVALMALHVAGLGGDMAGIASFLVDKHYLRKHGPGAYYGQP
jgi:L-ribulose-5-phosphate 4-epimerase